MKTGILHLQALWHKMTLQPTLKPFDMTSPHSVVFVLHATSVNTWISSTSSCSWSFNLWLCLHIEMFLHCFVAIYVQTCANNYNTSASNCELRWQISIPPVLESDVHISALTLLAGLFLLLFCSYLTVFFPVWRQTWGMSRLGIWQFCSPVMELDSVAPSVYRHSWSQMLAHSNGRTHFQDIFDSYLQDHEGIKTHMHVFMPLV